MVGEERVKLGAMEPALVDLARDVSFESTQLTRCTPCPLGPRRSDVGLGAVRGGRVKQQVPCGRDLGEACSRLFCPVLVRVPLERQLLERCLNLLLRGLSRSVEAEHVVRLSE